MNVHTVGIHCTYKSVESVPGHQNGNKRRPQPLVRTTVPPAQQHQPCVKRDMELWWKALSKMAGGGAKGDSAFCMQEILFSERRLHQVQQQRVIWLQDKAKNYLAKQPQANKKSHLPTQQILFEKPNGNAEALPTSSPAFFGKGWERTWELWQVPWDALKLN